MVRGTLTTGWWPSRRRTVAIQRGGSHWLPLIRNAYRIQAFQLAGGPDWTYADRFDVEATYDDNRGAPVDRSVIDLMLRSLLTERFKLVAHNEKRELPVYALVIARADKRLGPQPLRSTTDCAERKGADTCGSSIAPGFIESRERTMAQVAESLARLTNTGSSLNRLIIDRTGLDGLYDLTLRFTPDNIPPVRGDGAPAVDPNGASIFTALQERLGLKLEPSRAPVEVLVIDSVERPTPD